MEGNQQAEGQRLQFKEQYMKPWLKSISTRKLPVFYTDSIRSRPMSSLNKQSTIKLSNHKSSKADPIRPEESIFSQGCRKYDTRYKEKMFIQVMKKITLLGKFDVESESSKENIQQLKQLARKCTTYFQINNLNTELSSATVNIEKMVAKLKMATVPAKMSGSRNRYPHYKTRLSLSLSEIKWNLARRNDSNTQISRRLRMY